MASLPEDCDNQLGNSPQFSGLIPHQVPSMESQQPIPIANDNSQSRREADVGITELVNPDLLRFSGILKKRYWNA